MIAGLRGAPRAATHDRAANSCQLPPL